MAKTLLVLGASSDHLDVVRSLRSAGFRVITADPDPSAVAHGRSDACLYNISAESLLAAGQREQVCGILAPFSTGAAPVVAQVSAKLNLPGIPFEAAQVLASKIRLRELLTELQLPHPQTHIVKAGTVLPAGFFDGKTWILKPDVAGNGRGVAAIASTAELQKGMTQALAASITGLALLERQLVGHHGLCQFLIREGSIQRTWFIDRVTAEAPAVATVGLRSPSKLAHYPRKQATQLLQQLCQALKISDGLLLAEFVASENKVHLLELAPRLPGRGGLELVRLSAGVDLAAVGGAAASGGSVEIRPEDDTRAWGLVLLGPGAAGRLDFDLPAAEKLAAESWVRDLRWFVPQGTAIEQGSPSMFAAGRVLVTGRDGDAVEARATEVHRRLRVRAI